MENGIYKICILSGCKFNAARTLVPHQTKAPKYTHITKTARANLARLGAVAEEYWQDVAPHLSAWCPSRLTLHSSRSFLSAAVPTILDSQFIS